MKPINSQIGPEDGTVVIKEHSANGYRQGCRCAVCKAAESARQRGEPAPEPKRTPERAAPKRKRGKMERETRKTIKAMNLAGTPEQAMLTAQAINGARTMDDAMAGLLPRYTVTAGHRLQRDALQALRTAAPPPPLAHVVEEEDLDLEIASMHMGSAACQPTYPRLVPGVCALCDEATRAAGILMKRYPGKLAHEISGCLECPCDVCQARIARWQEPAAEPGI